MNKENLRYAASHEWIETNGTHRKVGISDHAQAELSDIVYVELPPIGKKCTAGDPIALVESVKAASDIYAPVSGTVVAINADLKNHPEWINNSPFEKGWLFTIEPSDLTQIDSLLDAAAYHAHIS